MNTKSDWAEEYIVHIPDGREARVSLPSEINWAAPVAAPEWLLRQLGVESNLAHRWSLRPLRTATVLAEGSPPDGRAQAAAARQVCLVRATTAAAAMAPNDPRQARLKTERLRLEKLNQESDYVRIEPLNVLEGSEPEYYRVNFFCRGITGIDSARRPIYGEKHQVEILCDDDFPSDVPRLRWVTPIWHPNIQHNEPKGVCVNKPEWLGGMGLDDLCRLMFEMVQYKNYHATYTKPFPLDMEVAKWVLEYAEPKGIVDKKRKIYVDDKPFTKPTVTNFITVRDVPAPPPSRIKLITGSATSAPSKPSRIRMVDASPASNKSDAPRPSTSRIKIVGEKE
ncbi:MAG: ubiquitin-conjugating enzyme E2 [Pyrinomonadaceae bacterium]